MDYRIHVGNISPAVDAAELTERFSKFGTVVSPLELKSRPTLDNRFGFITLHFDQKQYEALRRAYNNVIYRGSKLTLAVARPDFTDALHQRNQAESALSPTAFLNRDQLKRLFSDPAREFNTIVGRERSSRRNTRNMTIRVVKKDGKIAILQPHKKKLWGLSKRRPEELVFQYVNGQWQDGQGEVIESVQRRGGDDEEDAEMGEQEGQRNLDILNSLFGSKGENELQLAQIDFSDDEKLAAVKQREEAKQRVEVFDDTFEIVPAGTDVAAAHISEDSSGSAGEGEGNGDGAEQEALKEMFETTQSNTGFQFDLDNDDLDLDKDMYDDVPATPAPGPVPKPSTSFEHEDPVGREPRGLFFSHADSPFLSTQTQLAKIVSGAQPLDHQKWDAEFWEKRGEWNRLLLRRKRDVVRRHKHAKAKAATAYL